MRSLYEQNSSPIADHAVGLRALPLFQAIDFG
jgi:hypothetical protein